MTKSSLLKNRMSSSFFSGSDINLTRIFDDVFIHGILFINAEKNKRIVLENVSDYFRVNQKEFSLLLQKLLPFSYENN